MISPHSNNLYEDKQTFVTTQERQTIAPWNIRIAKQTNKHYIDVHLFPLNKRISIKMNIYQSPIIRAIIFTSM